MKFTPGSFAWLLVHDVRLQWRQFASAFGGWSHLQVGSTLIVGLIALHGLAWGALAMRASQPGLFTDRAAATAIVGILLWMVAHGLLGATRALYERADLDMLFSAPMATWKPVVSRGIAIAASSMGSLAPMLLPLANVGSVRHGMTWLSLYPALVAIALFGTALGFMVAIALFWASGPSRARMISQILAAVIAGAFVLAIQIGLMLPQAQTAMIASWLDRQQLAILDSQSWLVSAGQAAFRGDAVTLTVILALSASFFAGSVAALSGAFARASLVASSLGSSPTQRVATGRFQTGAPRALRLKEWRLLVRDPNVASQLGLQIVYTLPLAGMLLHEQQSVQPAVAVTTLIVVLSAQIASSLAWITVSGEDAPELIATAPIAPKSAALAKLSAIAIPLTMILLLPLIALLVIAPWALPYAVVFGALAGSSTAILNFWHPNHGNRRGLLRRHSQSKLIAMAEHGLSLLWALTVVTAMADLRWAVIPGLFVAILLASLAPRRPSKRSRRSYRMTSPTSAMQQI